MAAVTVLRRATGKAHPTSVLEADTILVGGLELSGAGAANIYADANVTDINIGTGGAATIDIGNTTGGAVTLNSGSTIAIGDASAGAITLDSAAGISLDGAAASNFTTTTGALTLDGNGGVNIAGNAAEIDVTTTGALDLNSGAFTLDCSTANITPTSTYTVAATGSVSVDSQAGMTFGGTNATSVQVGRSGITVTIPGNLVVQGTTTSVDTENLQTQDNHIYLNKDYTVAAGQTGGLALNYLPTATADTSTTGGFASTTTVNTVGAATFGAGDFVQVSGAANPANNGVYEVATHAGNVLTITGTPTHRFCNTAFTVDTGDTTAALTHINISVIQSNTAGDWQLGKGDDQAALTASLASIGTGAGNSLQQAYVVGNTITTSAGEGNVIIAGTELVQISATGGLDLDTILDFDGSTADFVATGAISLDAQAASNFSVTGAGIDLTLDSAAGRVVVDGGEAAADAVRINTGNAAGGIDIDAGTGGIDILTTGAFSIDGTGASNVTADTGNLTVATTTSGTLILDGVALVDLNAGANLDIDVTGTFDMLSSGAFSIDGTGASNVTTATGDLSLVATAGSVVIDGGEAAADAVQITSSNAAGGVDINGGTGGVAVDTSGPLSLDSTSTAANLTLTATDAGTATLTISATNGGAGVANLDVDADGSIDLLAGGVFSIDGTGASNVTVTSGNLTLSTVTSGNVVIGSAGDIDADAANFLVDATASFSLDAATASNVTVSGATADLTLGARGSTITLNESGQTTLDAFFSGNATSIIGAINYLATSGSASTLSETYVTTNRAVGEAVIIDGNSSADTQADASALSTSEGFVGIVVTAAASGSVATHGTVSALFENGTATPAAGDPIYLSEVAGRVTGVSPTGNPNSGVVVWQIGVLKDATGLTGGTIGTDESAAIHLQPMQPVVL